MIGRSTRMSPPKSGKAEGIAGSVLEGSGERSGAPLDPSVVNAHHRAAAEPERRQQYFHLDQPLTGVPNGDAPSLLNTSYNFKAEVEVPQSGADGMLITQGGYVSAATASMPQEASQCSGILSFEARAVGRPSSPPANTRSSSDFKYDGLGAATMAFGSDSVGWARAERVC